jgi:hypothetical protein
MDDAEFDRLRREICRSYNSSPHKKKYWLALLEMYGGAEMPRRRPGCKRTKESGDQEFKSGGATSL